MGNRFRPWSPVWTNEAFVKGDIRIWRLFSSSSSLCYCSAVAASTVGAAGTRIIPVAAPAADHLPHHPCLCKDCNAQIDAAVISLIDAGKFDDFEARQPIDAIDTTTVIGLRDRALIGLIVYSLRAHRRCNRHAR